jgi:hypothetical protein
LRELKLIRDSLVNSLIAIYHTRVTYPGFNPPDDTKEPLPDGNLDAEERGLDKDQSRLATARTASGN